MAGGNGLPAPVADRGVDVVNSLGVDLRSPRTAA